MVIEYFIYSTTFSHINSLRCSLLRYYIKFLRRKLCGSVCLYFELKKYKYIIYIYICNRKFIQCSLKIFYEYILQLSKTQLNSLQKQVSFCLKYRQ